MRLYLKALAILWQALKIRMWRSSANLRLPPVAVATRPMVAGEMEQLAALAGLVSRLVFWRRRRCFYRSFVLATLLREAGVAAVVNLGYCGLFGETRRRAHCWVSVGAVAVAEEEKVGNSFPKLLAEKSEGVRYWVGDVSVALNRTKSNEE